MKANLINPFYILKNDNIQIGDTSHLSPDEDTLRQIIKDEVNRNSFTTVVINGINPVFVPYLKLNVKQWTRQLS